MAGKTKRTAAYGTAMLVLMLGVGCAHSGGKPQPNPTPKAAAAPAPDPDETEKLGKWLDAIRSQMPQRCKDECKPTMVRIENCRSRIALGKAVATWHVDVYGEFCCKCTPDVDPNICKKCDYDGDGILDGYKGICTKKCVDTGIVSKVPPPKIEILDEPTDWKFEWVRQ